MEESERSKTLNDAGETTPFPKGKGDRGSVFVFTLLFTALLCTMFAPYLSMIVTETKLTASSYSSTAAMNLAEAGVEMAIWELAYGGADFTTGEGWSTVTIDGVSCYQKTSSVQDADGVTIGAYAVSVPVADVGTDYPKITATGYVPNQTKPEGQRTLRAAFKKGEGVFSHGLFGGTSLTVTGSGDIDSYDSDEGPYSLTHGEEGDVGSNGSITKSGSCTIYGDANPGPSPAILDKSGSGSITGNTDNTSLVTLPAITPSVLDYFKTHNNNSSVSAYFNPPGSYNFKVSGSTPVPLGAGAYYFTSMDVSGSGGLSVTSSVVIYVDGGTVSVSGSGIVNTTQFPSNFLVYSTGTSVSLSGSGDFYGAVYAPTATISHSGSRDFYGAMICGTLSKSGSGEIHYDKALKDISPPFAGSSYDLSTWQEK